MEKPLDLLKQRFEEKALVYSVISWVIAIFLPGIAMHDGYLMGYELLFFNLLGMLYFFLDPFSYELALLHAFTLINPIYFATIIFLLSGSKTFAILAVAFSVVNAAFVLIFLVKMSIPSGPDFTMEKGQLSIGGILWLLSVLCVIALSFYKFKKGVKAR